VGGDIQFNAGLRLFDRNHCERHKYPSQAAVRLSKTSAPRGIPRFVAWIFRIPARIAWSGRSTNKISSIFAPV
jgi:hypothetical protein